MDDKPVHQLQDDDPPLAALLPPSSALNQDLLAVLRGPQAPVQMPTPELLGGDYHRRT